MKNDHFCVPMLTPWTSKNRYYSYFLFLKKNNFKDPLKN